MKLSTLEIFYQKKEYIRDLRIAYMLGCYRLSHQAATHSVGFCFCFIFWIYKICCGWVVNFLCDLLWSLRIFFMDCCLWFYSRWVAVVICNWEQGCWDGSPVVATDLLVPSHCFYFFFLFKGFMGLFVLELCLFLIYVKGLVDL